MKRTRGNDQGSGWMKRLLQGAVVLAVGATVSHAWAAGKAPIQIRNVAAGSATMSQNGPLTTIRTGSHNTIINYQRLDVLSGHTLQFMQPSATSRVLNRIHSTEP